MTDLRRYGVTLATSEVTIRSAFIDSRKIEVTDSGALPANSETPDMKRYRTFLNGVFIGRADTVQGALDLGNKNIGFQLLI